jgi:hypothetical protein
MTRQWTTTKPPVWSPNAIQNKDGWIDPETGEILVAIRGVSTIGDPELDLSNDGVEGTCVINSITFDNDNLVIDNGVVQNPLQLTATFNEKVKPAIADGTESDFSTVSLTISTKTLNYTGVAGSITLTCAGYGKTSKNRNKKNVLIFKYDPDSDTEFNSDILVDQEFVGVFDDTAAYNTQGEVVYDEVDSNYYVANADIDLDGSSAALTAPSSDSTNWTLVTLRIGYFISTLTYDTGDLARDNTNGKVYICLADGVTAGDSPSIDDTNWSEHTYIIFDDTSEIEIDIDSDNRLLDFDDVDVYAIFAIDADWKMTEVVTSSIPS